MKLKFALVRAGATSLTVGLFLSVSVPAAVSAERLVKLEPYAGRLRQVAVNIAGGEHKFLFDTGGGHTLISPALAAALECRPSGRALGFRMSGERFETPVCEGVNYGIGSFAAPPETVGVYDLGALLPKELPPIDGLISLATFAGRSFALDLAGNTMIVDAALGPRSAPNQAFPCRVATGVDGADYVLFAGVERAGSRFWLEVDTGNLDLIRIAPHAATAFGLLPEGKNPQAIEFGLGRMAPSKFEARAVDLIYDGAINAQFLEQGMLIADLRRKPSCRWVPHALR